MMKFKLNDLIRFKIPNGALAHISQPKHLSCIISNDKYGWNFPGYVGEGFYHITTIETKRNLIVHEDDIELINDKIN